ncbi:MAG TPA: 50S ribosomal protein L35 [bacterium]|nr:MAG: 50S ribosomal protein L35 [bacterium ADurb.Bin236]HOC92046.1 50S ribosomal protein L35 [bacterium]HOY63100.1 50S ribosomal protein L35 [bacterium]HPI76583.1 50S ribosomal protein L35 [bacterium]HPN94336.1 50S ribosomal protein L35 [bacterium]
MPKMKSHSGARKRFKQTGSGKIVRKKEGMGHLLSSKSRKRKRRLNKIAVVTGGNLNKIKRGVQF